MKTTPFTDIHKKMGAKMANFAGYHMPISYTSIKNEHLCVRNNVGIFDVSHMGEFILRGPEALNTIQRISSNDASKLSPGKVQYSTILNANGGIVDDMLVYYLPDGAYMLVVNGANIAKDWQYLQSQLPKSGVACFNISEKTSLLAVQGPNAAKMLQPLTDMDLQNMVYYTCDKGVFAGAEKVLVSATGYTGAGGFEIYFYNEFAPIIWEAIMEAGKAYNLQPIGLAARDTLRLEKGFCLYGNDIDDTTTPLEAGLGWITKLKKGDFIGKDKLLAQKKAGIKRRLRGIELLDKGIARKDYPILNQEGTIIGKITSGTQSPCLQKGIALGYIDSEYAKIGEEIQIQIRKKQVRAKVVKLPFL